MPLHETVNNWIWNTVEKEGGNIHIGFDLWNILSQKGMKVEKVRAEAVIQTPDEPYPMVQIVRVMQNRIINKKVASENKIEIDTLKDRLTAERLKIKTTYVRELVFCAIARKK
jgi:hypothetical protein